MPLAHMFASRPISQSIYVRGVRDDLDRRVDAVRALQIALGFCKMCPVCLYVLPVERFACYQARCCRRCEITADPKRCEPVSFIP